MRFYELKILDPNWFNFNIGFNTTIIYGERDYLNLVEILDNSDGLIYLKFVHPLTYQFKLAQLLSLERLYYSQVSVTDCASNHLVNTKPELDKLLRKSYGKYFHDNSVITLIGFFINLDEKEYKQSDYSIV